MINEALRIYVPLEDKARLTESERRVRKETFAAGITAPDVETDVAPGGVIDQNEEVLGGVTITVWMIPATIRGRVETKIMAALVAAGFDPHVLKPGEG